MVDVMKKKSRKTLLYRLKVLLQVYMIYLTASLKNKLWSLTVVTLVFLVFGVLAVWQIDYHFFLGRQENSIHQLNSSLTHILQSRFSNPSETLAKSNTIIRLLKGELSDSDQEVRLTLDTARSITGADLVFILDRRGVMTASAEHPKKHDVIMKTYGFRPYFKAAMLGKSMLYAAVGAYTQDRGAFLASPVIDPATGDSLGVVVFKSGFEEVDGLFSAQLDTVLLVSPDGVIFSTNRSEWLFRTCHRLGKEAIKKIFQERQFPDDFKLEPLPVDLFSDVESVALEGSHYAVHKEDAVIPGWKLVSIGRYVFPITSVLISSSIILLVSFFAAFYLTGQEKKKTLQYSYDIQSLDLTRTRKELLRSEALLNSVVEDQDEMICRYDADRRINYVNGAFCRYFNRNRDELIGSVFTPPFAKGDFEIVKQHFNELTIENPVGEVEYRILMSEHDLRWHAATLRKIFSEDGKVSEYQAVIRDVTARKQNEEELREANVELSQYAYAVSHDLKAPLRAIHNYSDFLREDLGDALSEENKLYLNRLGRAVGEAEVMIEDLLSLSRVSHCSISAVKIEMGSFLRDILSMLNLPAEVKVIKASEWPVLEAEPVLVRQIFLNLISNAVKYNISAEKLVELGWSAEEDDSYVFYVRDNGIGIDKRYHEQIFRVFERLHTREEYEGTGAGLAIVKKAVSRLNGSIRLESAPGQGSTFYVTLPANQKERKL